MHEVPAQHEFPTDAPRTLTPVLVRDFTDGLDLDQVLLVRQVEVRQKRDGDAYLKVVLADRTGQVPAMIWDGVAQVAELVVAGRPVRVIGRFGEHPRYGSQITIRALRHPTEGTYRMTDLLTGPPREADQMEADLRELVGTVQSPHLRELLDRVLGPHTETWAHFRVAPAAKHFHQAYEHGLLEHSLTVAQGVSAISATFPGIDRDVAVTGALLHDIGKLEAYTSDPLAIDMTDSGRLLGEIPLGYYRVRREIEGIDGFPIGTAKHLLHIILSHHGTLEHGSPVVPATREATLVHFLDNLGGRLGSFDRLEKELAPGAVWTGFDRGIGGGAWFGAEPALAVAPQAA
jgi:3'-5' exoribonuclease